ncbi:Uma2 family endonuclease [Spongiactinospora sp. TRM90649]|uniref:Uma2 family endonuclease n=1 Tax=Spongiactinospora sp. TRM90649 TaxID=3031114 RepID=UPI0023F7603C|nr:Uma2 family endonuclease [Spongiactinospora sp. TRM90649]MDF5756513.1 Uma2 family endonuclease [Spongiactinospora sp. TRM90649]
MKMTMKARLSRSDVTAHGKPLEPSVTMPIPPASEPAVPAGDELTTLREIHSSLVGRTRMRAEIFQGRLIVSPLGSPEHQDAVTILSVALVPHAREKGWKTYAGLDVCTDDTRECYAPDLVIAPHDAPRWGRRELFVSGLVMVGEVVSPSSVDNDREHKPEVYATGGVPIYLLVDPIDDPPSVTVFSEPADGTYTTFTTVTMGKEIHIPEPIDVTLDTAIFL